MALLTQMEAAHTRRYLRGCFGTYYRRAKLELPPRFGNREWGFVPWGARAMHRHLAFTTRKALQAHLAQRPPAHAYHSVAYYREPAASKMVAKGWQGADLIFDLDADHMMAEPGTPFPKLMEQTRVETAKLVGDFLLGDLGLEPKWLKVYFSGGRGYHIHLRDPALLGLDSGGRRELVDYLTATGLEAEGLLVKRVKALHRFKGQTRPQVAFDLPPPEAPGWQGRLARTFQQLCRELAGPMRVEALARLLKVKGVGPKTTKKLTELARSGADYRQIWQAAPAPLKDHWLKLAIGQSRGHTDEPVTTDVHRLIRLPGSLHGGTGLAVVAVALDEIEHFDPYEAAVVLGSAPVKVRASEKPGRVRLKGEDFKLVPHEVAELPEYAAVYFVCRKWATLALTSKEGEGG